MFDKEFKVVLLRKVSELHKTQRQFNKIRKKKYMKKMSLKERKSHKEPNEFCS